MLQVGDQMVSSKDRPDICLLQREDTDFLQQRDWDFPIIKRLYVKYRYIFMIMLQVVKSVFPDT